MHNSLPLVPSDKDCIEEKSFPSLFFPFSYFILCLKSKAFIVRHFETSAQLIISHDRWSEQIKFDPKSEYSFKVCRLVWAVSLSPSLFVAHRMSNECPTVGNST